MAALDSNVINRFHAKTRQVSDKIEVGYVYAPKDKVLYDLVNKQGQIKLPIVAVTISSLQYDSTRVFNKLAGFTFPQGLVDTETFPNVDFVPPVVPVNLQINLSILAKWQTDLDQISQNFIVYSNPYFVISWKMPTGMQTQLTEIRSKCIWDGTINYQQPFDIGPDKTSHVEATTTFKVEGWLFPAKFEDIGTILKIQENITSVSDVETCGN